MLSINDLKNKMIVLIEGAPYQVLEVKHLHVGRGGSSVQTRIKNLATGHVFARNFKPSDTFGEADIEKRGLRYLYAHRGEYVFSDPTNPRDRFALRADHIGDAAQWLKPDTTATALFLDGNLLGVTLPIKMELVVTDAPPGIRGDTATGGTKTVTLETGARVNVPLFIGEGDTVRVNTETGEYVERVAKG